MKNIWLTYLLSLLSYLFYCVYKQFFTGWWFLIDALAIHSDAIDAIHIILGILGTISLIMVNSVTQAQLNGDTDYSGGCLEAQGARIWIFIGFVLGFAAIIAAVWVVIATFTVDGNIIFYTLLIILF